MIQVPQTNRIAARLFGIFFILAFASYGAGSALVASLTNNPAGLGAIHQGKSTLIIGVILIAIVHTFVNIGLSVLAYPILNARNGFIARGYLAAGITATTIAVVGALFLALLAPLSDAYVAAADTAPFDPIALVLTQGGFFGYQISMTLWGLGGLMLCYALYAYGLVPRLLAVWGGVGYGVFMTGTIAEMFGHPIGTMLALPGGMFELTLSVWLIVKGFNAGTRPDVQAQAPAVA